jgi:hypothetical protein
MFLTTTTTTEKKMAVYRRDRVIDIANFRFKLGHQEGIGHFRYFKKGTSLIDAIHMTEFRSYIDFDRPLIYLPPMPDRGHDAPFALQNDRIVVEAENETRANELIDILISKYEL